MFGKRFAYMAYITYILLYSSTFKFTFSNKDEHWVSTIFSIVCLRKLNWDFSLKLLFKKSQRWNLILSMLGIIFYGMEF